MSLDQRTNPVGMLHYALSYALSAKALEGRVRATHPDAPVRFLYAHACELYIKSFLGSHGESLSALRAFGHDFGKLAKAAVKKGLILDQGDLAVIETLSDAILDRYIQTGLRSVVTQGRMKDLCAKLNDQIGPAVYKAAGLGRAYPKFQ